MDNKGRLLEQVLGTVDTLTSVEPWTPKILFENCYIQDGRKKQRTQIHNNTDILSFNPDDMKRDFKIYFDLEKYQGKSDFKKLVIDLKSACIRNGFSINQNGSNKRKGLDGLPTPIYRFTCSHCKKYKYSGKKKLNTDPRSQPEGRKRTMICDRKNCRSDGQSLPRQTSTNHNKDACTFSFEVCYDGSGFIFEPPIGNKQIHQGHKQLEVHDIILRKSEITDKIQDRMIEDAGVALSIAGTHRVLNMITNHDGPFIAKSLVRSYRASNILRSHVDGTIVDTKNIDEIDQILDLLSKNQARVTYLSVKPFQCDTKKTDKILLSSSPTNEEVSAQGSYLVRCKNKTLGINVMGQGHPYMVVTKIDRKSSLFGLVSIGDRVLSINGESLERCSIAKFADSVASLADEVKTLRMQRKNSPSVKSQQPKSLEERQLCQSLTYRNGGGKIFTTEMQEELEKIARAYRKEAIDPNIDLEMFLSLAWICPFSHSVALMHANCVMVDTTFNVCRFTNYRQFSVCVKSTDGKVYTVARIGVPHEKSAILAWVIECCIPSLLTELFPPRVNCIISDGDPQLCNAIQNSLRSTYRFSIRLRCGYHICTRSWINNIDRCLEYHAFVPEDVKQDFTKLIINWCYSWMRPCVDSSAEFEVSKSLLFAWLVSNDVVENICTKSNAVMIINWIKESMLPYQEQFLFYRRKTVFNMDNYTTCPVEGTHQALKGNAIAVERTDKLAVYVKKATDYDAMKARDMQARVVQNQSKTYLYGKAWMNNLIERGALLTFNMIQHSEHYVSQYLQCMDGLPTFVVLCDLGYDEDTAVLGHDPMTKEATTNRASTRKSKYAQYTYEVPSRHPKFRHAWKVLLQKTVDGEYYLVCECILWRRCGMPCTHCYHVYNYHLKPHSIFMDFDYHCFKVQWWKVTDYLIHKKPSTLTETERDLLEKLMQLAITDVQGVRFHLCDGITDSNVLKVQWNKELCRGNEVRDEATLDPIKVTSMGAAERLLGWKLPEKGVHTEFGLVPTQRSIDFSDSNGSTLENNETNGTVNIRKHEECKKDLTTMLYDICDKVHFPSNELFFSRLKRSLDDFHTEAINIAMSNMSNEREGTSLRTFAGVIGHDSSTRKIHAFSSPKKKKKMTKNTITSP